MSSKNTPKTVYKSITPVEEIAVSINKEVNGKELEAVLKGVAAFTGAFNEGDKYKLDVKVIKVVKEGLDDGKSNLQAN